MSEVIKYTFKSDSPCMRYFGDKQIWNTPEELCQDFIDYIYYCEDSPMQEEVVYGTKGNTLELKKMRMPSMEGFCRWKICNVGRINFYKNKSPLFKEVVDFMEVSMYSLSLEGAAAGLLKESIVVKKLGLAEKIQVEKTQRVVIFHQVDNGRLIDAPIDDHDLIE